MGTQRAVIRFFVAAAAMLATLHAARAATPETAAPCGPAAASGGTRLLVTATGARRVAGNITFTLYGDRPERFLAPRGSIALTRVTLAGTAATTCFALSGPGTYAVAIYHDENNNHHFDRSVIGLPVEGYGFSRDAAIFLGPPSFSSVRFAAGPGDTAIAIRLRY
jgi:uncharacterized protein (DUF2141 family)